MKQDADSLREKFLDFFKSKGHRIVESDSLVPKEDPTVLFTPAGMNQFKIEFLGFNSGLKRVATVQRCLRTGDLEKVGKTAGHHTFFEMLGNFSFGDYFKAEAICWAWEFLTKELGIDAKKLWVSVYEDDAQAYAVWKDKIKVPQERIIKLGDKENFWPSEAKQKGPNGPCGPCSEIFYDWGADAGCKRPNCTPASSCGRFVEVWNLVFTQFNRKEGGILEPLPKKNIDTGMGLERLAAVMQGVKSNFETDLFKPIIKEIITDYPSTPLGAGGLRITPRLRSGQASYELIYPVADHIRAIVFAIYDGVLPSNEARGYVVRKLIRKCVLHLRALGLKDAFLYKLVPLVSEVMKKPYPELETQKENISRIILAEEENFISTLDASESIFNERFKGFTEHQNPQKAGSIAFQLYDTHGIPFELTKSWLDKHQIKISLEAFEKELQKQKARSKSLSAIKDEVFAGKAIAAGIRQTKFIGHSKISAQAKIIKIIQQEHCVERIAKNSEATVILDKTAFYPESGGQVADTGVIIKGKNIFEVLDTQKQGKVILHIGRLKDGAFKKGDSITAQVDAERRLSIARNHTATHLLQAALRKVLGTHVQQQGSLVAPDRLRFDFTHFQALKPQELRRVEEIVNQCIMRNYPLRGKQMALAEARKKGALAFFAEKYAETVRVVLIGDISQELCAGTHLDSTGGIGLFKIIQELSVASGIRRIEAVTGFAAYEAVKKQTELLEDVSSLLQVPQENILQELEKKISAVKKMQKQLNTQKLESAKAGIDALIEQQEVIGNTKVITAVIPDADMDLLRKTVDMIKARTASAIIALGANLEERALLVLGVTQDLVDKGIDASQLIRQVAGILAGSGGGRKDFAQAGGNNPQKLPAAFEELKNIIRKL